VEFTAYKGELMQEGALTSFTVFDAGYIAAVRLTCGTWRHEFCHAYNV